MSNMSSDFIFTKITYLFSEEVVVFLVLLQITKTSHWTLSRNFVRLSCILMPYQQQTIRHLVDESDFGELYINVVVDATVFLGKPFWPDKIINFENFRQKNYQTLQIPTYLLDDSLFHEKKDSHLIFTRNKQQYFVVAVPDFCIHNFFLHCYQTTLSIQYVVGQNIAIQIRFAM